MEKFSIKRYLSEVYQVNAPQKGKFECPFCKHTTMSLKGDELAKCFHPSCSKLITEGHTKGNSHLQEFLWEVMNACHVALIQQQEDPGHNAWRYLVIRKVHPKVITESPVVGVIPRNLDILAIAQSIKVRIETEVPYKERAKIAEEFDKQATELASRLDKCKGWLVFGYTGSTHQLMSFRFRQPDSKHFQSYKINGISSGVFNPYLFKPDEASAFPYLLLAEGEFNILRLQSLLVDNNLSYANAVALGSSSGVDWPTLKRIGGEWVLFQDHDEAGKALASEMVYNSTCKVTQSPHIDDDLDSFINRFPDPNEALQQVINLIGEAVTHYRTFKALSDDTNRIRKSKKARQLREFEVSQQVGALLIDELTRRGVFYRTSLTPYFLDLANKSLTPLQPGGIFLQRLLHAVGLNPVEVIHKFVLRELEKHARENGTDTEVYKFVHYDAISNTLYLYNKDSEVFRITPDKIEVVDNGTDGILFEPLLGFVPFERVGVEGECDYLDTLVLDPMNFEEGTLKANDYRLLLSTWFYSLFFPTLMATKAIPACIGGKGSGKTSAFRRLGILLFGKGFQVSSLPDKPDDFDAVVTNEFLVIFDNVDGQTGWLNDKLAIAATGGSIKKRELYTTNQMQEYPIKAHIAITSRTPKFRRDDVAERLLPFPLKTLTTKISEQRLIDEAVSARNKFMSWLLLRLQEILRMLAKTEGMPPLETELRMADYATFLIRLAKAEGEEAERAGYDILHKLIAAQSQFALEIDPLFSLLEIVGAETPNKPFTTAELFSELKKLACQHSIPFGFKSANSLGQKLAHLRANINEMLSMTVESGGGNIRIYRFAPLAINEVAPQQLLTTI